jgi:hypothetical protein
MKAPRPRDTGRNTGFKRSLEQNGRLKGGLFCVEGIQLLGFAAIRFAKNQRAMAKVKCNRTLRRLAD